MLVCVYNPSSGSGGRIESWRQVQAKLGKKPKYKQEEWGLNPKYFKKRRIRWEMLLILPPFGFLYVACPPTSSLLLTK
jgi:hypothetical protein